MPVPDFYNITMLCTYEEVDIEFSNDLYQAQLLQAFKLSNWDEKKISESIDKIYNEFSKHKDFIDILDVLKSQNNLVSLIGFIGDDNETIFRLLFGYDYFSKMHKCICDYYYNGRISSKTRENLINTINNK
tara:strand:+ start:5192 stop:5584 length:393 start_codon:yes stop_codon:yes gene_type:complete